MVPPLVCLADVSIRECLDMWFWRVFGGCVCSVGVWSVCLLSVSVRCVCRMCLHAMYVMSVSPMGFSQLNDRVALQLCMPVANVARCVSSCVSLCLSWMCSCVDVYLVSVSVSAGG